MRWNIITASALLLQRISVAAYAPGSDEIGSRSAKEIIEKLNLTANVEKGYFIQTYIDDATIGNRSYSTAIYYLLEGSVGVSVWHKVDATEVWHYYAGAPLRLDLSFNNGTSTRHRILGPDIFKNQAPQIVIEKNEWQRAQSLGNWTLVGTTVAPAFVETGYVLASPGWEPSDRV